MDLATALRTRNLVYLFSYNSIVKRILPLRFNPFKLYGTSHSYQFCFNGCWVVFFIFI